MSDPIPPSPRGQSHREATSAERQRLAKIRHDLRTPINHIIGYSEILLEEAVHRVPEVFLADLQKIRNGGERLLGLIQENFSDERPVSGERDLHQLCHDLRTPVNHIIGYSELLMDQCTELDLAEFQPDLAKINSAAKTWLALMERELVGVPGPPTPEPPAAPQLNTAVFSRLAEASAAVRKPAELPGDAFKTARILLADDDASNRELLRRRLEKLGCTITACSNGADALEQLRTAAFDLVLLDMLMPGLGGAEVLTQMKADPALRHLPVIMISALDQMDGIVRCIELGAEDYLAKPFNPVFLQARIGAALEKKRLRDTEQVYLKRIEEERAKSDWLLLNVLPLPIAQRLKNGESTIVDSFPEVTVLFADLVGFTTLSAQLSPTRVVQLLDEIFSAFDELAARHGLEKIKTIGDAYMAVAGLPALRADHAAAAARMALDLQAELARFNQAHQTTMQMRIGLNTGPVIAGIIGRHKFSYDLWGDTVNTASRMESHGEPGTIQITETTARALRGTFELQERGLIEVKGKGRLTTYLLVGGRPA